ncbi:MAG: D-2-hydroxyacid dehydrogenase [Pusillimonas sp.]
MKTSSALPLGLFISDRVDRNNAKEIDRLAAEAGVTLRRYTFERPPIRPDLIDAAFFSRDLYEGSSLRKPGPLSEAFFRVIDAAPGLRWLHVCSSGLDLPQYQHSLRRGVMLTASRGSTALPIAQTVLAAVLGQARGLDHWLAAQAQREWSPLTGQALPRKVEDQEVVIVGAGAIGGEIARLLKAVGFRTTAVRRSDTPAPHCDRSVSIEHLDSVLPGCDWLVLAAPLTEETRGLIDARRMNLLSPHARIVNIARGELLDETSLIDALRNGRLRGAYLDTFIQEPLPADSPLWTLPGVWISPHNSAASQGHEERVVECFMRELRTWLERGSKRA